MMHDFLANNRADLLARCMAKAALRPAHAASELQLASGVPLFLDQLIRTLTVEQTAGSLKGQWISGPPGGGTPSFSEIGESAAHHGRNLLVLGFSIDQVVHGYGDLCQAITDLACERDAPFQIREFQILNRCLDNAIADAVTEYTYQRESAVEEAHVAELSHQLRAFAHELRNSLGTAILAFNAVRSGNLPLSGATGSVLDRCLVGMRTLIDRSLTDVQVSTVDPSRREVFQLSDFIADLRKVAELEAKARGCTVTISEVDPRLAINADRDLLLSAVVNLVQNAFKFTRPHTEIALNGYASAERVLIDVRDHCGGLHPGDIDKMFLPFVRTGGDRTGLGLGLAIAQRSVESNDGVLSVRDMPGDGCIFTISLPRYAME